MDDEPILTELLSTHLQDHGYTVSVANSSDEALAKLNTKPNLILLDINMPGMDGLELCKVIRNHIVMPCEHLQSFSSYREKVKIWSRIKLNIVCGQERGRDLPGADYQSL